MPKDYYIYDGIVILCLNKSIRTDYENIHHNR